VVLAAFSGQVALPQRLPLEAFGGFIAEDEVSRPAAKCRRGQLRLGNEFSSHVVNG